MEHMNDEEDVQESVEDRESPCALLAEAVRIDLIDTFDDAEEYCTKTEAEEHMNEFIIQNTGRKTL